VSAPAPVISAWSAVSPFGVGRRPFAAGMRAGVPALAVIDRDQYAAPLSQACLVPAASPQELLGGKGTRSMDRATALAVCAVGRLLKEDLDHPDCGIDKDAAVVLGTSTGSISSIMGFVRDSLTQNKPYLVDPAKFPNTVMNCAASRAAIWHQLHGPNVTIAGGRAAALLGLNHARRLMQCARANSVVCGAVEEYSAERAWLAWHTRADHRDSMLLGEGSAVVLLEANGTSQRPALAEVLAVEVGLATNPDAAGQALARCIERVGRQPGQAWDKLWAVAPSAPPGSHGGQERAALEQVLSTHSHVELPCTALLGDTCSASGAFQIAALLARAETDPSSAGRLALVTAIDCDGLVAAALLRIVARRQS